ncbi:hypothetical protein [Kosakonia sp. MH5]|uniref:hypothetical protein n=1 Tax=Kosakonia sp. MH5 TaxID=2202822 RepID=UPI00192A36BC|nr:hypothetical protein [Kosakonia sp. MH5]NCF07966.1 hypothetical protein [Kosakonia sp. MH5]
MNMAKIVIDFNRLLKGTNKKLFAGRENGKQAYEYFKISDFEPDSDDFLELSIPKDIVVSSSYYLGMLEKLLPKFSSPKEFYKKTIFEGKEYQEGMLTELDRAVRRGLHKNVPFF